MRLLLNAALLVVLGLQLFTLVSSGTDHHLRLPGFARRALEDRLNDEGLRVSFTAMDVSFSGSLLLHGSKVFLTGSTEPVAEAELLHVEPDWLALLLGHRLSFSEVRLINANFYCPPESSPTGLSEPFITHLDAAVSSQGAHWWVLDHLHARFLNALIFAQGTLVLPPLAATPAPRETLAALYREWSRQAVDWEPKLAQAEKPSVEIRLEGEEPGRTKIFASAMAERIRPAMPGLVLNQGVVRVAATWDGEVLRANSAVLATVKSVSAVADPDSEQKREVFSARAVAARVPLATGAAGVLAGLPPRCAVAAAQVKLGDFVCESAQANLDLRTWPELPFVADVVHGPDAARVSGQTEIAVKDGAVEWHGGTFEVHASARLATMLAVANLTLPAVAEPLQLAGPVRVDGRVALTPDHQWQVADFAVSTNGAQYDRIHLDAVSAQGRLTRDAAGDYQLALSRVAGANASWQVEGEYFENLRTHDFHIAARGRIEPRVLDPYFKFAEWWTPLWEAIVPGREWPGVELAYAGNWDEPPTDHRLELSAHIDGAKVRGVATDRIRVRVQTRPDYIAVYDIDAQASGGGRLSGGLAWSMVPGYARFIEQRGIFDSTLPLPVIAALGGPGIAEVLRPLNCPTAPVAHLDQRLGGSANAQPRAEATKIHAEVAGPLHAYRVPLDSAVLDLTDYGSWVDVPRCDFTIAGGQARAVATVQHHPQAEDELSFSATLEGARGTDFINALRQLQDKPAASAAATNGAADKNAAAAMGDPAHPALLDLVLGGRMRAGRPETLVARGAARLSGAQLGQLHLLGSLSRALADTKVPLGDFNLTAATSEVQIAQQFIRLPNLQITGPTARVVAAGIYNYDADVLNFNVLIFPLQESESFFLRQISNMVNPFSNTVTFKLHGKIAEPTWNVSMDPLRLFENQRVECPEIPGYPDNADGSPIFPALPAIPALPAEKK